MRLSQIVMEDMTLIKDGQFEVLAQCSADIPYKFLTFIEDAAYLEYIRNNRNVVGVICHPKLVELLDRDSLGIVCSEQPRISFFQLHNKLVNLSSNEAIFKSKIGKGCLISSRANIDEENVIIGDNVVIEDNVVIRRDVEIGDNCIIGSGSVIGGQGYEYKRIGNQDVLPVVHVGKIVIESFVEIKEMCTIHRALFSWDCTEIGEKTKIDAHAHIGHATKIGKRVMIGSHANLAGNIVVEDDVYIGLGSSISNRLKIGRGSKVSLGSVVTKNVEQNSIVTGNFAIDHQVFINDLKRKFPDT